MAMSKSDERGREGRSFSEPGDRESPEKRGDPGYDAARAHQLALRDGEPGYGYGEDYKRDRRRDENPDPERPAADRLI